MTHPENSNVRQRIVNALLLIFGLTMTVTPLTLWIAPTKFWFYFVFAAFFVSAVLFWIVSWFDLEEENEQAK